MKRSNKYIALGKVIEKGRTDDERKEIRKVLEERIKIVIGIETKNKIYEWKHAMLVK